MTTIKATENEFKSQLISWLNQFITQGNYPFEEASGEPSLKISTGEIRFPDVILWLNREAEHSFCGGELKTPHTSVDDDTLLKEAVEKARGISANFFFTWNMRETIIWRVPLIGSKVSSAHRLKTYPAIHQISKPDDLWDNYKQVLLKERAKELLDDMAQLHKEGHLYQVDIDTTFFVKTLREIIEKLTPHFRRTLKDKIASDSIFRNGLGDWAVKQGIQNYGEQTSYETISRQMVYRMLGKILFYQTLRRHHSDLGKIDIKEIDPFTIADRLREYFGKAKAIDYQAVFDEDFPDKLPLPRLAGEIIGELVENLNRYNFSSMPQDVIGRVFEQLVPAEERHLLGQYFTPEDLVDIINAFCNRSRDDFVLDPTCGSGTFLIRAYNRLNINFGERSHKQLLSKLWGFDIVHFPAELATINLFRQNLAEYSNVPRIKAADFFEIKPSQDIEFAPPKAPLPLIRDKLPSFDAGVGNFPFIRQELINRKIPGYKDKLERAIAEDWLADYPEGFYLKDSIKKQLEKNRELVRQVYEQAKLKLSGQADIYAYLFFHTARFLKEGGRMGFVTSNAWLDVAYGYQLQRFFLNNFKIIAILESRCEPWFEESSVNTIVTILERCSQETKRNKHLVKFVKVKKKLEELIPYNMKTEAVERWSHLDALVGTIERAGREFYIIKDNQPACTLKGLKTYDDENFRIRVIKQSELLDELQHKGKTVKWGVYLRAPDVYFEILDKCHDKLIPLKEIADVKFGIKTGINEFFYLTEDKIQHWEIEEEFLKPVLKSPKEFVGILIDPAKLKIKVFYCQKGKEKLKREGKFGALRYIEWGEKQKTKEGNLWKDCPSVKNRKNWYSLPSYQLPKIIWTKSYDVKFLQRFCIKSIHADQRVYHILERNKINASLLAAILNSTLCSFFIELIGRVSLGDGALDTTVDESKHYLLIPDLIKFPEYQKRKILDAFNNISERPIKPIFEEVRMKDRQRLDSIILKAIGLESEKYLKPIYQGITELVNERLNLPKLRKKKRVSRVIRDVEKLKRQVVDEILPQGPRNFPEAFLDLSIKKEDFEDISIPAEKLNMGRYFMGFQEVVTDLGFIYEARSIEEAKYLIYAQKPNVFVIRIPKNKIAIKKSVDSYEKYLKDLKGKIFEAFYRRTLDHQRADILTNTIFEEHNIPDI